MNLLLLTRSLESGGAERQLVNLAEGLDRREISITIATFYSGGNLEPQASNLPNVEIVSLHKKGKWDLLLPLSRLRRLIISRSIDTVYSFLPGPNLLSLVATTVRPRPRIVWGIRAAYLDLGRYTKIDIIVSKLESTLSRLSDKVIVNSKAGSEELLQKGFRASKITYIPNGINTDHYSPRPKARQEVRRALGLSANTPLVGIVARIDPQKDHVTFLDSAKLLMQDSPDVVFLCIGGTSKEMRPLATQLSRYAETIGISESVMWLGEQTDITQWISALDVATLTSSMGEGSPNILGEAMSCGIPCVATDVGDSKQIIGDAGMVVPAGNAAEIANAWRTMLSISESSHRELGQKARERIIAKYSVERMCESTLSVLKRGE